MNTPKNQLPFIGGVLLIGIGILLLLAQVLQIDVGNYLWPFWIIGGGAVFFLFMLAGRTREGSLAIPGSIIGMIGLILLFMNTFGHWEAWAYAWTLIIASVGIGMWIWGRYSDVPRHVRTGKQLIRLGLILFLAFGIFFEVIIGFNRDSLATRIFWPAAIVVLGIYLLVRSFRREAPVEPGAVVTSETKEPPAEEAQPQEPVQ